MQLTETQSSALIGGLCRLLGPFFSRYAAKLVNTIWGVVDDYLPDELLFYLISASDGLDSEELEDIRADLLEYVSGQVRIKWIPKFVRKRAVNFVINRVVNALRKESTVESQPEDEALPEAV